MLSMTRLPSATTEGRVSNEPYPPNGTGCEILHDDGVWRQYGEFYKRAPGARALWDMKLLREKK